MRGFEREGKIDSVALPVSFTYLCSYSYSGSDSTGFHKLILHVEREGGRGDTTRTKPTCSCHGTNSPGANGVTCSYVYPSQPKSQSHRLLQTSLDTV